LGGELSDHLGRLPVLLGGWSLRVLVLILLATATDGPLLTWGLFLAYAGSLAMTEGPERALIGDYAPPSLKATAYGLYHMTVGLAALPGAVLFGSLWQWWGATAAFLFAANITLLSATLLIILAKWHRSSNP